MCHLEDDVIFTLVIDKCSEIMNSTFRNSQVKFTKSGYFELLYNLWQMFYSNGILSHEYNIFYSIGSRFPRADNTFNAVTTRILRDSVILPFFPLSVAPMMILSWGRLPLYELFLNKEVITYYEFTSQKPVADLKGSKKVCVNDKTNNWQQGLVKLITLWVTIHLHKI
jgi:hypothetical protein